VFRGCPIKDVCSQARRGLFSAVILLTEGKVYLDTDVRALYFMVQKLQIFRNLWCVHMDKERRVEPVRTICGLGGGVNFSRFCTEVFYGRPLILYFKENFLLAMLVRKMFTFKCMQICFQNYK